MAPIKHKEPPRFHASALELLLKFFEEWHGPMWAVVWGWDDSLVNISGAPVADYMRRAFPYEPQLTPVEVRRLHAVWQEDGEALFRQAHFAEGEDTLKRRPKPEEPRPKASRFQRQHDIVESGFTHWGTEGRLWEYGAQWLTEITWCYPKVEAPLIRFVLLKDARRWEYECTWTVNAIEHAYMMSPHFKP